MAKPASMDNVVAVARAVLKPLEELPPQVALVNSQANSITALRCLLGMCPQREPSPSVILWFLRYRTRYARCRTKWLTSIQP